MRIKRMRTRFAWLGGLCMACVAMGCPDEPVIEGQPGGGDIPPPPPPAERSVAAAPQEPASAEPQDPASGTAGEEEKAVEEGQPQEDAKPAPGEGAVGEFEGEAAGGPEFAPLPEDVKSQRAVKSSDYVTVSGSVEGNPCQSRQIRLEATTMDGQRLIMLTGLIMQGAGGFELAVPKGVEKIWMTAVCDLNENNRMDGEDLAGAYVKNPISSNADSSGVTIKLAKMDKKGGGPGEPPLVVPQ